MAATAGIVAYSSGRREILDHMLPLLAFEWAVAEALERHVWQEVGRRRLIDLPWRIDCRAKVENITLLVPWQEYKYVLPGLDGLNVAQR